MVESVGKVALFLLDLFIRDRQAKEEYARRVMAALAKWDREAVRSGELREMFEKIEREMKESKSGNY